MKTLQRPQRLAEVQQRFRANPVVMLLGPRQCGKTTLAREFAKQRKAEYFDLELPADAQRLAEPMTTLEPLRGTVVIDEAQLQPALFPVLRVLADRKPLPARFLLLGSASPDLVRDVSESLAGRVALVPMSGFDLSEVGAKWLRRLWWRGGFPRSFLAASDADSRQWREDFIQTFLERDLRRFGVQVAPAVLRRFWNMVAHYHGQIWNASEIGRSLGEAHTTVKHHLDILCGAFVMRQLPPWFENVGKRQVKSPKVYLRDSGLLHALLGISSFRRLEAHPKLGASWEGFAKDAPKHLGEPNRTLIEQATTDTFRKLRLQAYQHLRAAAQSLNNDIEFHYLSQYTQAFIDSVLPNFLGVYGQFLQQRYAPQRGQAGQQVATGQQAGAQGPQVQRIQSMTQYHQQ
jgi:predicted AAA+ superfamily ATPase